MNFSLNYTIENEIENAEKIACKLKWFKENNYRILLPHGINEESTRDEVRLAVRSEFREKEDVFMNLKTDLEEYIERNEEVMEEFFSYFNYDLPEKIIVNFTSYGPGGMYTLPNIAVVILKDSPQQTLQMILHEVIHLIIEEPFVKKYNLSHWEKELTVDTLCLEENLKNIFENYKPQPQTVGIKADFLSKLGYKKER
jgi:hypothetical protein